MYMMCCYSQMLLSLKAVDKFQALPQLLVLCVEAKCSCRCFLQTPKEDLGFLSHNLLILAHRFSAPVGATH